MPRNTNSDHAELRLHALLARHPVIRRARQLGFPAMEKEILLRHLAQAGIFPRSQVEAMRVGPCTPAMMMRISATILELHEGISRIERSFTPARRDSLLDAAFATLETITGIPNQFTRPLFSRINWETPSIQTLVASGCLPTPDRQTYLAVLQSADRHELLALIAKRISHDLLIHGNSLRYFYQALPLMRETIDAGCHGLTNRYIGFAAATQLQMILHEGSYPDGAALRAGRIQMDIKQEAFQIRVYGINFPSLFNELVKGLYEALLHPGMPTAAQLGPHQEAFRELTSGPDLEFELMKIAPTASLRFHQALVALEGRHKKEIRQVLRRAGQDDLPPLGVVSLLYRAFSKLNPDLTLLFMARPLAAPLQSRTEMRLFLCLIENLED